MQDASTQAQHSLRREAWSGGGASCWDGSLSPFLLADSSLFFHPTVVSNCIHCKSPGTTFIILPGTPESQGLSSLQIFGKPGPALSYPSGAARNCVIYSGPRKGCTSMAHTHTCIQKRGNLMGLGKKRGLVTVTVCACVFWPLWASITFPPFIFGQYK